MMYPRMQKIFTGESRRISWRRQNVYSDFQLETDRGEGPVLASCGFSDTLTSVPRMAQDPV
jgi:hypothetical protein